MVKSLNGIFDSVNLTAGSNITITPSGNALSISAPSALSSVTGDSTLEGNGTSSSPLRVAIPFNQLASINGIGLINLTNTNNGGYGMTATGGDSNNGNGGHAIQATGGNGRLFGGDGIQTIGGDGAEGGSGVGGHGGAGSQTNGGAGLWGFGGDGPMGRAGVVGIRGSGTSRDGRAGHFFGNVVVQGTIEKSGGSFKIDHPLDPANKYLYHSFVESPDMKNIYDGVVRLDADGAAVVELPEWFEALNKDFRYLLTPVGAPMPGLYIAEEVSGNRFRIAGGQPGSKVSWQVTGVRQDAYANKHRISVEEDKPERERGYYLHPEVFNQAEEKSIEWALLPEMMREIKRWRQEDEKRRQEKVNKR